MQNQVKTRHLEARGLSSLCLSLYIFQISGDVFPCFGLTSLNSRNTLGCSDYGVIIFGSATSISGMLCYTFR